MPSPFEDAKTSFALAPPNQDPWRLGHSPRLDMVAKKAGRTFLISSWRDAGQPALREGAVYTGPWLLDTRRMRNVVYVLAET
jgi:hypothetical protein